MTTDLWMLVYTALLSMFFFFAYLPGRAGVPGGLAWAFGNRDTPLAVPAWTSRAERAHQNLVENLAPFAILVLVAHVAGKAKATTARRHALLLGTCRPRGGVHRWNHLFAHGRVPHRDRRRVADFEPALLGDFATHRRFERAARRCAIRPLRAISGVPCRSTSLTKP
jgi:uncharacterized MAPEG superfamily protein